MQAAEAKGNHIVSSFASVETGKRIVALNHLSDLSEPSTAQKLTASKTCLTKGI